MARSFAYFTAGLSVSAGNQPLTVAIFADSGTDDGVSCVVSQASGLPAARSWVRAGWLNPWPKRLRNSRSRVVAVGTLVRQALPGVLLPGASVGAGSGVDGEVDGAGLDGSDGDGLGVEGDGLGLGDGLGAGFGAGFGAGLATVLAFFGAGFLGAFVTWCFLAWCLAGRFLRLRAARNPMPRPRLVRGEERVQVSANMSDLSIKQNISDISQILDKNRSTTPGGGQLISPRGA